MFKGTPRIGLIVTALNLAVELKHCEDVVGSYLGCRKIMKFALMGIDEYIKTYFRGRGNRMVDGDGVASNPRRCSEHVGLGNLLRDAVDALPVTHGRVPMVMSSSGRSR
jgi:hypothetical protein